MTAISRRSSGTSSLDSAMTAQPGTTVATEGQPEPVTETQEARESGEPSA